MSEKRKLTLKDIGRELGISVSTVSRALKEHPDIAQETIKLVKDYAETHNYVPNLLAVNFRKNRTFNIGLIVPELVHHFFSTVISGAIFEANRQGYNLMVSQSNDILKDEILACKAMLNSSVDGLLISISNETDDGAHLLEFLNEGKPVVQFDKITDKLPTPKVIVDDFDGAYSAVKHLIDEGYTKIAHLRGRKEVKNSSERCDGYLKAIQDHNLKTDPSWVKDCLKITDQEGYDFTKELMESENPPNAIFCITDLVALGALRYLKEFGYEIPKDVGIIGFSNWMLSRVSTPQLSTVEQHGFQIGMDATSLLLEMIKNNDVENLKTVEIKTELVIRESSELSKVKQAK
ncbi:transcriptional regulator [Belliella baltica DSM 15883]|uniref:Transcriptional regulator n=1 Tax=Belliella baltica (strain DSM 15883 / CIP 108006 / LMG 21964 / BA134) TaxID=866536 RepID=I3Z848_BELBD|nr:LacI family DNA-binding transcriptional regulator [Belliella baltica]AFL85416.1 transcriptional regulator [Belliella baltica DSM 15883]